ncbi:MAG: hypothetical protein QY317_08960 [Candidatus Jettenia caeni]|nr:MAG: hypothetical protein QY317_08960 [Candidatus Jettenia caeni]
MYYVSGEVINYFSVEETKGKDGKVYPASDKLQLLGEVETKSGDIKKELLTFVVPGHWKPRIKEILGKKVFFPIQLYVSENRISPFVGSSAAFPKVAA